MNTSISNTKAIEINQPSAISLALIFIFIMTATLTIAGAEKDLSSPGLTDAEIAMIVVVADTIDVNYGKLAVEKANSQEVIRFAETMIRDHTAVNDKAIALAKKLGVSPEASQTSKKLESAAQQTLARLTALSGASFDKAYVANEVSYHEAVIKLLDTILIPTAKNAELKKLLESGRPIFAAHLDHAKHLHSSLSTP